MSSKSTKEPETNQFLPENTTGLPLGEKLSEIIIPYSSLLPPRAGSSQSKRSPIHLTILKIEFEKACRDFWEQNKID